MICPYLGSPAARDKEFMTGLAGVQLLLILLPAVTQQSTLGRVGQPTSGE